MKKIFLLSFAVIFFLSFTELKSQNWTEGFETTDTMHVPTGWSRWIRSNFPLADTTAQWNVRDTGRALPGLNTALSKSHSGRRAVIVTWWMGVDTNNGTHNADDWLVTRRIHVWAGGSYLSFWWAAGGGSAPYRDSFQVWVSTVDSTPQSFTHYILTKSATGPYGTFEQEFIPFDEFVGQTVWVGFRYYMDCSVDGYVVHIDDIEVQNPIGIKPLGNEIPRRFDLKQNYPNPFNPITNIVFDIASKSFVNLIIYNSLGQVVNTLVNQDLSPGSYKVDFDAGNLPSGAYFYRITAGNFVKTNKMILVK